MRPYLAFGVGVDRIEAGRDGRARAVVLADGARIACGAVLVGIGVVPAGELLGEEAGIPTDACGRTGLPGVYACGDVAAAYRPSLGRAVRVEHWTSAEPSPRQSSSRAQAAPTTRSGT